MDRLCALILINFGCLARAVGGVWFVSTLPEMWADVIRLVYTLACMWGMVVVFFRVPCLWARFAFWH